MVAREAMMDHRWPLRWMAAAVLFTASVMLMLAGPVQAAPATDMEISDAVEDELMLDTAVPLANVDVISQDGVVTLSGTVDSLLKKERAARIAETVRGVRSVVNQIVVVPGVLRTDADIRQDVQRALLADPATESYEVDVSVLDGQVTLDGMVESWQERNLAETVAKSVRGVIAVENDVAVTYAENRTDAAIRTEIEQALRWDALVDHALIEVGVDNGDVRLSGTVGSAAEKRRAVNKAWIAGVDTVDSTALEVARWARDEALRKGKYTLKSDAEIRDAVEDALVLDPRVNAVEVIPTAANGIVTLRGTVDNLKAKRAAAQDARNTVGVHRVENRIKVRPVLDGGDNQIEESLEEALVRDPFVERYEIFVDVTNGIATLTGAVDSYFEKTQAEDVASRVIGVVSVDNNLVVEDAYDPYIYDPYLDDTYLGDVTWYDYQPPAPLETDASIKEEINDEMFWSPFVDADQVKVSVEDGVATLKGKVDSWSEVYAATENAQEGGAVWVINELDVNRQ